MRKITPSPPSFASFTGFGEYLGVSDYKLNLSLAENVDLPAIFRTIDQGVVPGDILTAPTGEVLICSGNSLNVDADTIVITFAPIVLLGMFVSILLSKSDSGGTGVRIPGTEWYLEASMHSVT